MIYKYFEEEKQQIPCGISSSMKILVSEKIKQPIICSLTFITSTVITEILC